MTTLIERLNERAHDPKRAIDEDQGLTSGGNFGGRMLEKNAETLKAALADVRMERPETVR